MKKTIIIGVTAIAIFLGGFFWLVSKASPDNAPQDVISVDIPDNFEK